MNRIKKLFSLLLVAVFVVSNAVIANATDEKRVSLVNMSSEECFNTLLANGLEIPEGYKDYKNLEEFVKKIVSNVVSHPECEVWFNYTDANDFALAVREIVLEYENIQVNSILNCEKGLRSSYPLIYSTFLVEWIPTDATYNCYAYALGRQSLGRINPGAQDGITFLQSDLQTMTIDRLASFVAYDLQALGYTEITYGSALPSYQSGYNVIAVRKCEDDFHFMRMMSTGTWQHKPGGGAVMRYNYSSLTSGRWTNERIVYYQYYSADLYYDSDIIYIKYKL
ncbi:MAG: hypothetical protein E7266_08065 [Lachnospiraceae bacterium]|nr:hypothetical protein [Lachnospiraceae bacterium]